MQRKPEAELMDDAIQALAYAEADFDEPHGLFMRLFSELHVGAEIAGRAIDLGCGPCDITARFAAMFPHMQVDAVDGAAQMLLQARARILRDGLADRVTLYHGRLPDFALPARAYTVVLSNSLLHHLVDPMVLWDTVRHCGQVGARVLVMDLMRPDSESEAESLVAQYAEGEPEILRRDFFHSLLAAYSISEVRGQLRGAGLVGLVIRKVSDRHLVVSGRLQ